MAEKLGDLGAIMVQYGNRDYNLSTLAYADDVNSMSINQMKDVVHVCNTKTTCFQLAIEPFGLENHPDKCEVLARIRAKRGGAMKLLQEISENGWGGGNKEKVKLEVKSLGTIRSVYGTTAAEVKKRMEKAEAAYRSYFKFFNNKK